MPSALLSSALPGEIKDFGGGAVPQNYLLCDGSSYLVVQYQHLFAAIGYTFGGSGANFNVPDLRRRIGVGSGGTGTGTLGNAVGNTGGEENHVLSVGELASHTHGISDPSHNHFASNNTNADDFWLLVPTNSPPGIGIQINSGSNLTSFQPQTGNSTTGISVNANGSGSGHNTIQPSLVVTKMIRF